MFQIASGVPLLKKVADKNKQSNPVQILTQWSKSPAWWEFQMQEVPLLWGEPLEAAMEHNWTEQAQFLMQVHVALCQHILFGEGDIRCSVCQSDWSCSPLEPDLPNPITTLTLFYVQAAQHGIQILQCMLLFLQVVQSDQGEDPVELNGAYFWIGTEDLTLSGSNWWNYSPPQVKNL